MAKKRFKIGDRVVITATYRTWFGSSGYIVARSHESVRHRLPWLVRLDDGSEWGFAEDELVPWFVPEQHQALSCGRLAP